MEVNGGRGGEALRAEFKASVGKQGPLLEWIEKTVRLIDAIVYRLLGLSEENIMPEANVRLNGWNALST